MKRVRYESLTPHSSQRTLAFVSVITHNTVAIATEANITVV